MVTAVFAADRLFGRSGALFRLNFSGTLSRMLSSKVCLPKSPAFPIPNLWRVTRGNQLPASTGGSLVARPRPEGGFELVATLPLEPV